MDLSEIVKHLRDEASSHAQQAADLDTQRTDHLRKSAELELHAKQIEAVAGDLPDDLTTGAATDASGPQGHDVPLQG